ncbi:MAG: PDGLE domain-containing protein [Methanomicrobiaceae archaeon]|nr:PDGLE domain-containing protein [Methanomicrobiaceae archaeon]
MEKKTFIMAAVALAVLIAVLAPFLASSNPDGLESAFFSIYGAKEVTGGDLDEGQAELAEDAVVETTGNDFSIDSPMPDYSIAGLDKPGEVFAVVIGTLLMIGLVWGVGSVVAKPKE